MRRLKDLVYEDKKENKTPKLKIEKVAKPDENLVKPSFEISYLTSFYYSPIKKFLFTPKFDPDYMNFSNCEHKNIEKRMVYVSFIPLCIHINTVRKATNPIDYDPQLKMLALTTFLFSILLGIGYIL